MSRCRPLAVLLALPVLLLGRPVQAQQADTTTADTTVTDTTAVDTMVTDTTGADSVTTNEPAPDTTTAGPPPADTARAARPDTAQTGGPAPADTSRAATDADTLATEAPSPADTTAQDGLSAGERRARAREQARAAAASWLSLTDAGKFGASWDAAAPAFKDGIPRDQWIRRGEQARAQLRALEARTLVQSRYRDSTRQLPGDRPVVTLQYRTQYEGRSVLEAVITTKRGADWAVAGYRIVPRPDTTQFADSTQAPSRPDSLSVPDSTQQAGPDSTQAAPDSTGRAAPPDTTQPPPPDTTQAPPADTSQAPPADTSQAPPPDTTQVPPADTTQSPPPDSTQPGETP